TSPTTLSLHDALPIYLVQRYAIQSLPKTMRVARGHDALSRQHGQMSIVNRHQRRQKQLLRIFEIVVEDVGHIFRRKSHRSKYMRSEEHTSELQSPDHL